MSLSLFCFVFVLFRFCFVFFVVVLVLFFVVVWSCCVVVFLYLVIAVIVVPVTVLIGCFRCSFRLGLSLSCVVDSIYSKARKLEAPDKSFSPSFSRISVESVMPPDDRLMVMVGVTKQPQFLPNFHRFHSFQRTTTTTTASSKPRILS